ncbi:MAG: general secretion pathway protein GspK [Opitutaceae bacterium]
MILVLIVVLSAVLVQFTEKGMTEIIAEGHYVERNRMRITAFSALETTLAVMADVIAIDGSLTTPEQGWADPLAVAGFDPGESTRVEVSFEDESGKLPLANLDEGTLYLLFTEMGLPIEDSLKLTHSLLDWIDEDDEARIDGAESETYAAAEWPYMGSNRPVAHLEELAVVDGFSALFFDEAGRPNDWFRLFTDAVTPYETGNLNANSVSDLGLRAFAGFGDPQVDVLRTYLAGADGIRGTEDDRYFAEGGEVSTLLGELPSGISLGVTADVIRVRIDVFEGDSHYGLAAMVQPSQPGATGGDGDGGRPGRPQRPRPPAQGDTRSTEATGGPGESEEVPYPFVFLELTEDVGHNDSLAAPAEAVEETLQESRRPASGPASSG